MKAPIVPLPILNDHKPILLIFDPADPAIELAYERAPLAGGNLVRRASRDSEQYWIPRCTPVFAIANGTVIYANKESDGHAILIDHGGELLSSYSRLAHMYLTPTDNTAPKRKVTGGEIIGYIGTPRGAPFSALRFEIWQCNEFDEYEPTDPLLLVRKWQFLEWRDAQLARAANDAAEK